MLCAQAPALIPYQAVARDAAGQPLANTNVNARITIHEGSANGTSVWQETQTVTTSALGLFTVQLGSSVPLTSVNWANGSKFMQLEIDLGSGFVDIGTQQMLSVPYAFYAGAISLNVSVTGDTLFFGEGNFVIVPGISDANSSDDNNNAGTSLHSCGVPNVHNPDLVYGSITDREGNVYKTIVIGSQEWMAENLNVSTYQNGDEIATNLTSEEWSNAINTQLGTWTYYYDDDSYACPYGKLYNWFACVDSRELCPIGWHVPTDQEWSTLINFLDSDSDGGNFFNTAGIQMKSSGTIEEGTGYWYSSDISSSNSCGFSGLPGSFRSNNGFLPASGCCIDIGYLGQWWSSSEMYSYFAWTRSLALNDDGAYRSGNFCLDAYSVRCLRDSCYSCNIIQGCTNSAACNYYPDALLDNGSCYFIGDACDDNNSATFGDLWRADCVCEGVLGNSETIHSCGYENVHNPNLNYGNLIDQDGNSYKTIVIGSQEWMAENLATTRYSNGDLISSSLSAGAWQNSSLTQVGAWTFYNDDISIACPYGKLYNWYACADPRGLCPSGWHLPTDAEWTLLTNQLGGEGVAGGQLKTIGSLETGLGLWLSPNVNATNTSGFSGLPVGGRYDLGNFCCNEAKANWWTATDFDSGRSWNRYLVYYDDNTFKIPEPKEHGLSVRCIRDEN